MTTESTVPSVTELFNSAVQFHEHHYQHEAYLADRYSLLMDMAPDRTNQVALTQAFAQAIKQRASSIEKKEPQNVYADDLAAMYEKLIEKTNDGQGNFINPVWEAKSALKITVRKLLARAGEIESGDLISVDPDNRKRDKLNQAAATLGKKLAARP